MEPKDGWVIFFDWDADGISDHVGIVKATQTALSIRWKETQETARKNAIMARPVSILWAMVHLNKT